MRGCTANSYKPCKKQCLAVCGPGKKDRADAKAPRARAGLAGAWIGLTVQHCGNHGAMSTRPAVNRALGLCNDLIGGSSLLWQYHHQARPCGSACPPL